MKQSAAEQESLAAIAFGAEDGGHGLFAAERAARLDAGGCGVLRRARGGVGLQEDAREEGVHRVGAPQQVVPGDAGVGGLRHGVGSGAADQRQQRFQIGGRGTFGYGGLKARDLLIEIQQLGQDGRLLREFLRTFDPPLPGHLQSIYL